MTRKNERSVNGAGAGSVEFPMASRVQSLDGPAGNSSPSTTTSNCSGRQSGHTLAEVMVAIGLLGFTVISLYAGFSSGFAVVRVARENLRATQIISERMELLRLVKWGDLITPGFIPSSFTAPFSVSDATNGGSSGFNYTGTVTLTTNIADMPESSYATNLCLIQIDLTWTSGTVTRKRQMTTYASKYGMQNYIY